MSFLTAETSLQRLPLLDADGCARVVAGVQRLQSRWLQRAPDLRFYTLGAASYLDEPASYAELSSALNPLLCEAFAGLYERLQLALSECLRAPVVFVPGLARPGFHIWGVPGIPTRAEASLHFDLQYLRVPWPRRARAGFAEPLSFTLPLALPRGGGGLSVWPVSHERVNAFFRRTGYSIALEDLTVLLEERREEYACGELVLHSGHVLHRIAPVPEVHPEDLRITLQGHGVRYDGAWHLYW